MSFSMRMFVRMPALGEGVKEATVTRLLKQDGDTIDVNALLCEVSTGDMITGVRSPSAGVLVEFYVREGDVVSVGAELAVIGDAAQHRTEVAGPEPESAAEAQTGGLSGLSRHDTRVGDQSLRPGKLVISAGPLGGAPPTTFKAPPERGGLAVTSQPRGAVSSAPASAEVEDATARATHILSRAQQTADRLTSNAKDEADNILSAAQARALAVLNKAEADQTEAERQHAKIMATINQQRIVLEGRLEQLRTFERDYRTRLKSFLELKLEELGPPVASTSPSALERSVAQLQTFERDYRTRLRSYLESQLEELVGRPSSASVPGSASTSSEPFPTPGFVTADDVRNVSFSKPPIGKHGYDHTEVDALLDRVEEKFRDPQSHSLTPEDVHNVAFSRPPIGKCGYNEDEVDAFLEMVEAKLNHIEQKIKGP